MEQRLVRRVLAPRAPPSQEWQVVLRTPSDKLVLYHAGNNELVTSTPRRSRHAHEPSTSRSHADDSEDIECFGADDAECVVQPKATLCPSCGRPLPPRLAGDLAHDGAPSSSSLESLLARPEPSYFALLSRAGTPRATPRSSSPSANDPQLDRGAFSPGYYASFFEEIECLGRGGNGTVWLVRHVLNKEPLGLYAVKRIAVGDSSPNLLRLLKEVHVLETLQHPNIIHYQHCWIEDASRGPFGPPVPTLHILMQFANGGSLEHFVAERSGALPADIDRKTRVKMQRMGAVHFLRLEEILHIFKDVVAGLDFLHSRGLLHLDVKAGNVLLVWSEDLMPTAKLSDFGETRDYSTMPSERTGYSGTVDWIAPELWTADAATGKLPAPSKASDLWSLGLILHYLAFFRLPYTETENSAVLKQEIQAYRGFQPADVLLYRLRHDLPSTLLDVMASLINRKPPSRPSCPRTMAMVEAINARQGTVRLARPARSMAVIPRRRSRSISPPTCAPSRQHTAISAWLHSLRVHPTALMLLNLIKLLALLARCRASAPTPLQTLALFLSTAVELHVCDARLSLSLLVAQAASLLMTADTCVVATLT